MTLSELAQEMNTTKRTISTLFDNTFMHKYRKNETYAEKGKIFIFDNQADAIRGYYILKNEYENPFIAKTKDELSWSSLKWSNGYGNYISDIASNLSLSENFICNLLDNLMINYWQGDMYLFKEQRNLLVGYFRRKRDIFNYQYGIISEAYKNANDILYNALLSLNGLS